MLKIPIIALLLLSAIFVRAQKPVIANQIKVTAVTNDTSKSKKDTVKKKRASLNAGLTYSSNSVYLARTDSIATPNIGFGVTYTLKSGIFFGGAVNYIPSRQFDKLDAGSLETGYNFNLDNLSGGISVSKYFASFNSTQIISALDATLGAELSYDLFDVITPSIHADYALVRSSGGNDIIIAGALSHEFEMKQIFLKNDHLSIEPKIELTAGTQNFLSTYYTLKRNSATQRQQHTNAKGTGKGLSTTKTITSSATQSNPVTANTDKFQTLAYEFSLPIGYTYKKVGISLSPAYAIAVHKIDDNGSNTFYLPNSSVFYFQFSISYTL